MRPLEETGKTTIGGQTSEVLVKKGISMNLHHDKKTAILVVVCCALTCMIAIHPVQADRARVATIVLLASGVGLKFGSVFMEKSAQDSYDQYLNAAVQSDIAKHRDDYTSKHNQSVIMSRTGMGFVGLAMLISLFDELELISKSPPPQPHALRLTPRYNPRTHETALLLQRQF